MDLGDSRPEVFVLSFIPLFIAMDTLGNLPFVLAMSEEMTLRERCNTIHIAVLTSAVVALIFLFFGRAVLDIMGISVGSFAIAGG